MSGEDSHSAANVCAICLLPPTTANEAFLDNCFHCFCYEVCQNQIIETRGFASHVRSVGWQCILAWSETQQHHPPLQGPTFACPLCKTPYTSIIYDCEQSLFR